MTESDALVERLRRANRRCKALALATCAVVVTLVLAWIADGSAKRLLAERAMAEAQRAVAEFHAAARLDHH